MIKDGDKLTRFCERKRSEKYTAIHDFTIWSSAFAKNPDYPDHIKRLLRHLAEAFAYGVPEREKSSSGGGKIDGLEFNPLVTDLIGHAMRSGYQGWARDQHPVVQKYLADNDPLTIGLEVPVWDDETNGFIDVLRIHDDWRIEIADFKPNAAKDKKAASQVARYANMLMKNARLKPEHVFCTWFDDQDAFILLTP